MYRTTKKKMVRQFGVSAVVAVGALVTGAGVANASTHAATKTHASSLSSSARTSRASEESVTSSERRGGVGGDITALTTTSLTVLERDGTSATYKLNGSTIVTNNRAASTAASLALGENVHLRLSATDATVATQVDVVPAHLAGKVTVVVGGTITVVGPDGKTGTIVTNTTTTFSKAGAPVTQSDVTVGSFVVAEGTFGSTPTTVDATTVGIGQPASRDGAPGDGPMNLPGGPLPGVRPGDGRDNTY